MNFSFLKNKLISDTIFYYIGKLVPGLVGFFSIPIFIKLFGTATYGEYSILISTVFLLSTFVSGWIGQTFMRFYTKEDDKAKYILFTYKILLLNVFAILPIMLITFWFLKYSITITLLFILSYLFLSIYSLLSIELRTKLLSKRNVIADSIRALLFLLIILLQYLFFKDKSDYFIAVLLSGNFISYFLGVFLLKSSFISLKNIKNVLKQNINKIWLKEMLSYGMPIAVWMITAYLLNISDRYIIKYFLDFENVGLYSGVYDIFYKFMTFVFMPFLTAFQPIIIKLYNEGEKDKVKRYLKKANYILLSVFIILLFFVFVFKDVIVFKFLKFTSLKAVAIVVPIFIGAFIWNFSMFVHKPLELKNKTIIMLYGVLIAFVFNFVGNILFIPEYGIVAAAYTTLFGTATYLIFILFFLKSI